MTLNTDAAPSGQPLKSGAKILAQTLGRQLSRAIEPWSGVVVRAPR